MSDEIPYDETLRRAGEDQPLLLSSCGERFREQRKVVLNPEGQEFHGYSVEEILALLAGLRELGSNADAATWTGGSGGR